MPRDETPPSSAARPGAARSEAGRAVEPDAPSPSTVEPPAAARDRDTVDAFLALASHELRTPLQAMGLQLEMMRGRMAQFPGEVPTEWVMERLERMGKLVKRSTRLAENLLDISDIAQGHHQLRREPFDLAELTEDVLAANAEALRWARCDCRFERSAPVLGRWDRPRIERVLENLLGNAIKYAPGAPIEVKVWADATAAFLSVRDGGPGIASADQLRIFERFQRGAHEGTVEGFGLGLWIVKTIAEEHGGDVQLESSPGAGATFTISLPTA